GGERFMPRLDLGQAEIQYFDLTASREKEVRGLDVAVHDTGLVSSFERAQNCDRDFAGLFPKNATAFEALGDCDALKPFHGKVGAVAPGAGIEYRADVRMDDRGCGAPFAFEAHEGFAIEHKFWGDQLEGGESAEERVLGFVDGAHGTAADFFKDAIFGDD